MAGWIIIVIAGTVWEVVALCTDHETLSAGSRRALTHPIVGPVIVGGATAGLWHIALSIIEGAHNE
jgi:hypothetical protein